LVFDKKGDLYGTTQSGGANNEGTVFKLAPTGVETVLYSFGSQPLDGAVPSGGVFDKKAISIAPLVRAAHTVQAPSSS